MRLRREVPRGRILGLFLLTSLAWPSDLLYNNNFQTGNLNGWQPFTTTNGTLGTTMPTVVPFTNNGVTSDAAQFEVGQTSFLPGVEQGGGVEQTLVLPSAQLVLSADISFYNKSTFANNYAGEAILLIDNVPVRTYTAGVLNAGQLLNASLNYVFNGDGQQHTIALEFERPAITVAGLTPYQLVYDISLVDPPGGAPEPSTWLLAGTALAAAAVWRRRRGMPQKTVDS